MFFIVSVSFMSCDNDDNVLNSSEQSVFELTDVEDFPQTRALSNGVYSVSSTYKNNYEHKPDQSKSQVAAYVSAYNSIYGTNSLLLSNFPGEDMLVNLATTYGGNFKSEPSTNQGKADMLTYMIGYLSGNSAKPIPVYGVGTTLNSGGIILFEIDEGATYNSTTKYVRYTDLRVAGSNTSYSTNVKTKSVKAFLDGMAYASNNGVLNAVFF